MLVSRILKADRLILATCATLLLLADVAAAAIEVKVTQNTGKLMPYQVFELTFQHQGQYESPLWDVTIEVTYTSPSGRKVVTGGFFYGSSRPQKPVIRKTIVKTGRGQREVEVADWPCDPADLWKARYAPSELGGWKYQYTFGNKAGESTSGKGTFSVVKGRVHQKGWVRINPDNPFRFMYEDGSPYFPIGYQHGVGDHNHNGSILDTSSMEGPFRLDASGTRPKLPAGAMFVRGPSMGSVNRDVHMGRHSRAGFNMWRFSPNNAGMKVLARDDDPNASTLDNVRWEQAIMVDEMLEMCRKYDVRVFYGIFGYTKVFNFHPDNAVGMAKVKRLIKYSVDRWGAYVDIWQFLNEQAASTGWYEIVIAYLKSIDPYSKPLTTSWERPELEGIDINAPHRYKTESELQSDWYMVDKAANYKRFGKPVVFGEQGNRQSRKPDEKARAMARGFGGVWDPGSARRMRVRCWASLLKEMHLIFWETSYAKDGHSANIWIGPEERQYVRALQSFAGCLDGDMVPRPVHLSGPQAHEVRTYALRSEKKVAIYLHHAACTDCARAKAQGKAGRHQWNHKRGLAGNLVLKSWVKQAAKGYWYDPRTANIIARIDVPEGRPSVFEVPPFEIDIALLITNDGPPDVDGDGVANDKDPDDDNDGVPDTEDAWPLEREEWADADGDRIGDNMDADIDADGKGDDRNNNDTPDHEETDLDGDGVPNAGAIPWDAFPRDPKEWRDTDGDGTGDNADTDDDGDGYTDDEERKAGTDPLSAISFP